jgi:hypothetical protein
LAPDTEESNEAIEDRLSKLSGKELREKQKQRNISGKANVKKSDKLQAIVHYGSNDKEML